MMSLPQADKVGHSFPSKPLLLMRNPLPPSRGRGSTSTWTAESFDQAPSLASHPLDAEHPPHLPHEDDHLSLFTPFAPPLSSFQQLLVPCPRGGKVMDHEVNILRCLSPSQVPQPTCFWTFMAVGELTTSPHAQEVHSSLIFVLSVRLTFVVSRTDT